VDDNLIGIMKTHLLSIDSNLKPIRIPNEKVEILKKVSII
jgi:hypothetical protein